MSMLHTVNKSPLDKNSLSSCIAHAKEGSAILLIEDGVYGAMDKTSASAELKAAMKTIAVFALKPDLDARGIGDNRLIDGIKTVDYAGFVDLTEKHNTVQSWL